MSLKNFLRNGYIAKTRDGQLLFIFENLEIPEKMNKMQSTNEITHPHAGEVTTMLFGKYESAILCEQDFDDKLHFNGEFTYDNSQYNSPREYIYKKDIVAICKPMNRYAYARFSRNPDAECIDGFLQNNCKVIWERETQMLDSFDVGTFVFVCNTLYKIVAFDEGSCIVVEQNDNKDVVSYPSTTLAERY